MLQIVQCTDFSSKFSHLAGCLIHVLQEALVQLGEGKGTTTNQGKGGCRTQIYVRMTTCWFDTRILATSHLRPSASTLPCTKHVMRAVCM